MALAAAAARIADTPFAEWAAGSPTAYPAANVLHLLGLVLLVGGIGLVDLRLIGAFRALPLHALARALTPLAVAGIIILAASGSILFAADATALATSETFRTKLLLIAAALVNAALFRMMFGNSPAEPIRTSARLMGAMSLGLWLAVAAYGRMIAYS